MGLVRRLLEGLCRFCGLDDLADRVRRRWSAGSAGDRPDGHSHDGFESGDMSTWPVTVE